MKIYDFNGCKNICGIRVRQARVMQRVTQTDLAARLQVAGVRMEQDGVSRIEKGARFVADYELVAISKALEVSMEWLTGMG